MKNLTKAQKFIAEYFEQFLEVISKTKNVNELKTDIERARDKIVEIKRKEGVILLVVRI